MTETPTPDSVPDQPQGSNGLRGRLIAIGVYIALSFALFIVLSPSLTDQEQLQQQLRNAGGWGLLIYVGLYALQVFIPWLPGSPLDAIGGALFGFWQALIIITASSTVSGLIVILVVRQVGLEKIVERFPGLLEAPWKMLRIIRFKPWTIFLVNLLTGDVSYFIAGAARTPLVSTLLGFALMRLISVSLWAALGTGLLSAAVGQQLNGIAVLATVVTVVGLLIGLTLASKFLPGWLSRIEQQAEQENIRRTRS